MPTCKIAALSIIFCTCQVISCFRFLIGQYVTIHGDVVSHVNISRVRVEDGGQYTCAVSNRAGEMEHAARLNIYGELRTDLTKGVLESNK
jgi:hypothetical protein